MTPQPMIAVKDVAASSRWYQAVLGLKSAHGGNEYEMLMNANNQLVLQLHHWDAHEHPHLGSPRKAIGNGAILWFHESKVKQAYTRACKAEGQVLEALHLNPLAQHHEFWLRDPDGYVVVVSGDYLPTRPK